MIPNFFLLFLFHAYILDTSAHFQFYSGSFNRVDY